MNQFYRENKSENLFIVIERMFLFQKDKFSGKYEITLNAVRIVH